ncbi:MAG: HAMP domain-containing histidine kinase [Bacteriovorax sp.]|nr:HAMP domain-containing histidine kinase [Bacteriovorax sp.]
MPNQASDRIKRLSKKIIQAWEDRALKEVDASIHKTSLALSTSLPEFLENVAEALSTTINRTETKVRWDRDENTRINTNHGKEQAESVDYTMDQLIFEYHILRQVIFDIMEEEAPLSTVEREVIICFVEQAVNDAATQFCKSVNALKLKYAKEEDLLASIRTRDEFLTVISHELKTPLTSLLLKAQMILKHKKNVDDDHQIKKIYEFVGHVNVKVKRLSLLIEDILDFGRVRTGRYMPHMSKINICDIIDEVIDSLDLVFQAFKVSPPEFSWHEDSIVSIDKNGFEKVFRSLFTNAIKYGQGRPVSIDVKVNNSVVEIIIIDHGVGIKLENIERIFTKFERAVSSNEVSGLGLGLYIAREIITAHGGDLWVESKLGEGSAFHFSIPRLLEDSTELRGSNSERAHTGIVINSIEYSNQIH